MHISMYVFIFLLHVWVNVYVYSNACLVVNIIACFMVLVMGLCVLSYMYFYKFYTCISVCMNALMHIYINTHNIHMYMYT